MKEMRRVIALVLSLVMIVGMVPATAFAAEADVDYLFLATDRHTNTSIIGNIINNMEKTIGENELDYLGLGGDMVGSGNSHPEYDSSEVLGEVTGATSSLSAANVDIVAGIHDMNVNDDADIVLPYKGGGAQIYEGKKFYVYGVEEYCISEDSNSSNWSSEAQKFVDWANGSDIDTSKVIVVLSHYPLHVERNDNDGAYYWHKALNDVATNDDGDVVRNIFFFHGHNHTVDSNEYVYNVGDTMKIQNGSSTASETIYYTYATAGYLKQNSNATLMTITDTAVTLTKYGTGSSTPMTTVERVAESAEPEETTAATTEATEAPEAPEETTAATEAEKEVSYMTISEGSGVAYVVGDAQILYKMYVSYTDGTSGYVTQDDCTLTIYNENNQVVTEAEALATVGTYSADVTYLGVTCGTKLTFTVDASGDSSYDLLNLIINGAEVTADVKNVTADVADVMADLDIDGYVAYDITAELAEGATATVSIPVSTDWADTDLTVYYITDEGVLSDETFGDAAYANGYVTFTVSHFSTYVVTTESKDSDGTDVEVPGNSTTTKVAEEVTVYKLVATPESDKTYLIVNSATGTGYGLDGDTTGYATTAFTGGDGYYSSYDESAQSGTAFSVGSDVYLTTDGAYLWTAGDNSFTIGYDRNSSSNVGGLGGGTYSYTLNPANKTKSWTLTNSQLTINLQTAYKGLWGDDTYDDFYLTNSGSTWGMGTSGAANVYFYEPVTIYKVTEQDVGTQTATYGINITVKGTAASAMNANNVVNGDTLTLGAEFTSTVSGQEPASGGTYAWTATTNNGVASVDENGKVTFTGKAGTETVQVSYTWTENGTQYTISNTLVITATAMSYTMGFTQDTMTVKIGATAAAPLETKNSEGTAVTATGVTWTSDNEAVATVANGIVTGVKAGTATITAEWTDPAGKTHTDTVEVSVVDAVYVLTIDQGDTATQKGVKEGVTLQLTATLTEDDEAVTSPTLTWYAPYFADGSSATSIATIDENGLLTFTGAEGTFKVLVAYTSAGGTTVTDIIEITARKSTATTPSESTTDFPRWPDDGAIRFDKTASAVGNFSETGIAQVELSMAGLPVTTGGAIDVVLMLDQSTSMDSDRINATVAATKVFIEGIVKNSDGSYNESRIYIGYFNGDSTYDITDSGNIGGALATIDSDEELEALYADLEDEFDGSPTASGTNYDVSLERCYNLLTAAKTDGTGDDRQQFAVLMSDGGPTDYATSASQVLSESNIVNYFSVGSAGTSTTDPEDYTNTLPAEYWSGLMKGNGVTVYSVGLILQEQPSSGPQTYREYTDDQYYYITKTILTGISSGEDYFFNCESASDTEEMEGIFGNIAEEINAAASNVQVEDTIGENYDLIFELPLDFSTEEAEKAGLADQEFYIEVLDYPLDTTTHERTGAATIKQRVYLATVEGKIAITKIQTGSITASGSVSLTDASKDPVFEAKGKAEHKAYYTWTDSDNDGVADVGEYSYVADGTGTHNMTSGAYLELNTDNSLKMLHACAFTYDAVNEKLIWTVTEMSQTSETALRYFVYLDSSGGVTPADQIEAGSYYTNEEASLTYTNFKGTECLQYFPKPQMTWNGAQVSYVFYLVNEDGVPVNRAGREVTFAEAVFVTDIYTYAIVWNDLEQAAGLEAKYLAYDKIPGDYRLYDVNASYNIHVYEDEKEVNLNNHFVIGGTSGDNTTYVYNNKTDVKKYNTHGTYAATGTYLCKSYSVEATFNDNGTIASATYTAVSGETQVLASNMTSTSGADFTDANGYVYYIDEEGDVYTIVQKTDATAITGFDFSNTTVAFAVVWEKKLVDDTVVVDFGLPVDIDVVSNDFVYNHVSGISATAPGYDKNTGTADNATITATELTVKGHSVLVKNENTIRFTPGSGNSMIFNESVEFYYESPVEVYVNGAVDTDYMYAKVTVIPATTVYYEDSFVDFAVSTKGDSGWTVDESQTWEGEGSTDSTATQAQDRPGTSQITSAMDADNLYGYDAAYDKCSTYSLGSARKISVTPTKFGTATFTFYGTGFDVIGLTSNNTGFITATVYAGDTASGTALKTFAVDTYYGYSYLPCKITMQRTPTSWDETAREVVSQEDYDANKGDYGYTKPGNDIVMPNGEITYYYEMRWVATPSNGDNSNAIYQIPVISVDLLAHDLTYGQYTVVVKCAYNKYLDHTNDTGTMTNHTVDTYDFYLDAIRIYNPTGGNDTAANDAYVADGERWPFYEELRNKIVTAETFNILNDTGVANGIVYIDGNTDLNNYEDYYFYGPNNELYLDKDQAVAFYLDAPAEGLKSIQLGLKNIQGNGSVKVYAVNPDEDSSTETTEPVTTKGENSVTSTVTDGVITTVNVVYEEGENEGEYLKTTTTLVYKIINGLDMDLKTATDMNYDITNLNGYPVVILNDSTADGNVISITTVKATYDAPRPVGLVVSGKTEYTVGDAYEAPTVTVYYADGTHNVLTADQYEVDETVDTTVADTYSLTYSYIEEVNGEEYEVLAHVEVTVMAKAEDTAAVASETTTTDYSMLKVTRSAVTYAVASLSEAVIVEPEADEPENDGSQNDGSQNDGSQNDGSQNDGSQNDGSQNNGSQNSGSQNNGSQNSGSQNSGSQNNGSQNNGAEDNEAEATEPEADAPANKPESNEPNTDQPESDAPEADEPEADAPAEDDAETEEEPAEEATGFWGWLKKIIEFLFGWLLKLK